MGQQIDFWDDYFSDSMYKLPGKDDADTPKERELVTSSNLRKESFICRNTEDIPKMRALTGNRCGIRLYNLPYHNGLDHLQNAVQLQTLPCLRVSFRGGDGLADVEKSNQQSYFQSTGVEVRLKKLVLLGIKQSQNKKGKFSLPFFSASF